MPSHKLVLRGWLEIFSQSLLLASLLLPASGILYPLYVFWPTPMIGFWLQRPQFLSGLIPFVAAALLLHLLESWHWFHAHEQETHPFRAFAIERHVVIVGLGTLLAGNLFHSSTPAGLMTASGAYGMSLSASLWLCCPDSRRINLLLWSLLQSLGLSLIFTSFWLAGVVLMLLGLILIPYLPARTPDSTDSAAEPVLPAKAVSDIAWPWLRLGAASVAGLLVGMGYALSISQSIAHARQQNVSESLSQREQLRLNRPVLRGEALPGNGFDQYWKVIGNTCTLTGRQPVLVMPETDVNRARNMFDLETGVLVPDFELLVRYAPQLGNLQSATRHSYMRYPFADYLRLCGEELPQPDIGRFQDMILLQIANGLAECNRGACSLGASHILDAARALQDFPISGQITMMMVAYKLERILVSALGTRIQSQDLSPNEWHRILAEWQNLLAAEEGLFRQILDQEMLLAEHSLIEIITNQFDGPWHEVMSIPGQLLIFPFFKHGMPEFKSLNAISHDYLDQSSHVQLLWKSLIYQQKSLSKRNPFVNTALIDIAFSIQRFREHEVVLRGFYQHLALQAYAAQHGKYPVRLQELVPDFLTSLPADPYTGRFFMYRNQGDSFILYSLGENQRDDGGDGFYGHFIHKPQCSGKELVFGPFAPENCRS